MKVKVIQTDIKMLSLVVSIIRLSLKEICLYMISYKQGSLPWILNGRDQMSMEFIKPTSINSIPNSIHIN